ncbi:MAG TPA: SCO family protein [Longimicrobiales bacterium]|nr:SCO family protein [Longimicrobiales bacterium]
MARRLFQIVTGVLAGLALVAGAALLGWPSPGPGDPDPHTLSTPFPAPELRLTDHAGAPFVLEPEGRVSVVFFGFTHCPDVCPLTLANLARAVESLGGRASVVQVAFVTVDPARDTPERMAGYVGSFHPGFVGLTGSEEEIAAAAAAWGVYRSVPEGREDYTVDHTARSFVLDHRGRVAATFPSDADAESMARTLRRLTRGL